MSKDKPPAGGIVSGGGWVESRFYQRKAQLFRALALLWIFPSTGAALILLMGGNRWWKADSLVEGFRSVVLEE